ncbi:MAG: fibronectin type III domain-containing protein, partial [Bacteroidota bacterium]
SGISIVNESRNNSIVKNSIGIDSSGNSILPNGSDGVHISNSAKFTQIGGSTTDSANTIAFNNEYGVRINGLGTNYNKVTHNSIYSNNYKGIAVLNLANLGISAPVITSFDGTLITGTSSANAVIEFFADSEEEGKIFIDTAKADVSGNFFKQLDLSSIPDNFNLTATQTSNNNTSEFSNPFGIPPSTPQNLVGIGGIEQVSLHWNPNSESDLHKYNIFRGISSPAVMLIDSVIVSSSADTNYIDINVAPDITYFYRMTAVDSSGNESDFSNEVSATPIQIGITVLNPNGGEQWQVYSVQTIKWLYSQVDTVKIEYSTDSGTSWELVADNVLPNLGKDILPSRKGDSIIKDTFTKGRKNTISSNDIKYPYLKSMLADTGSYSWTIPNTPSTQCLVRITDMTNSSIGDTSDGIFTIPQLTIIVVTSSADIGPGTLRQALLDAVNGAFITFDTGVFPPSNPSTISLTSGGLPSITQGSITIDASNAGVILDGSMLGTANGFHINSDSNSIKGLQIQYFTGSGVHIGGNNSPNYNIIGGDRTIGTGRNGGGNTINYCTTGISIYDSTSTNNKIIGNYVGVNYSGTSALPNINGIVITAPNNTIGSSILGERNVISGNQHTGIRMDRPAARHNLIIGNFIGTDYTGTDSIGNDKGIWITHLDTLLSPSNNIIGGSTLNERNIISGNTREGITIDGIGADSNIVRGNFIGVDKTGLTALPNGGHGIGIWNGPKNNLIGGDTPEHRNIISGNILSGIGISGASTDSNSVKGNYI